MWGFADQAMISATNFLLMTLLARQLGPHSFGEFTIAYTLILFLNSFQSALFTQPHNVLGASRSGDHYVGYTRAIAVVQMSFSLIAACGVALAATFILQFGYSFGWLMMSASVTVFFTQIQEYVRRIYYTEGEYRQAFVNGLIAYGGQVLGTVILWHFGFLSGVTALLIMALGPALGILQGKHKMQLHIPGMPIRGNIRTHWDANWAFGRWLGGSTLAYWLSTQLYPILTAGFVGVAATGGIRAAQTLVAPTTILTRGIETMIPSRAAAVYSARGVGGLRAWMTKIAMMCGALLFAYLLIVSLAAPIIVVLLFGEEYEQFSWLVTVLAASYGINFIGMILSTSLKSMEISEPIFYAQFISAVVVMTFGVAIVYQYGIAGTAVGMILNSVIATGLTGIYIFRRRAPEGRAIR
jgi:O-antigen/teichoic acid export membrane protein